MKKIIIKTEHHEMQAELNDTKTAELIWEKLPLEGKANIWGNEIYFEVPIKTELENGRDIINKGEIGYWPLGNAVCFFFGPTPVSQGEEIRAASPVSIIGNIIEKIELLKEVKSGEKIRLEKQ
jgi:hypothetical protein